MAGILAIGAAAPAAPNLSSNRSQYLAAAPPSLFTSSSVSFSSSSSTIPSIYCGRGDRKTAKGKRFSHSFGNARPKDKSKGRGPPMVPTPPAPPKKDRFDDGQIIKIEIDESLD